MITRITPTNLIVSADDFGLTSAVNEEIIRCMEEGIVTSTSIISCGRAADAAIKFARSFSKDIGLGVHLTLDNEQPISDPSNIPSIVSKRGHLLPRAQIMIRLCTGQIKLEDIYCEWSAQIEKVMDADLRPDHIDSHGHIHVFPTLLSLIIHIAEYFGISAVRLPLAPDDYWLSFKRLPARICLCLASKIACAKFKSLLRYPDFMLGFSSGGCYSESAFLKDIGFLKNCNIAEAMFHPGPVKIDVPAYNSWGYNWAVDSATLRSNSVKDFIAEKGIKLMSFKDLL